MPRVVGVYNAPPVYTLGLAGVLSRTGFSFEEIADPLVWLRRHRGAALLVAVHDAADLDIVVELTTDSPESVVVTLVDELDVGAVQASLSAGATGSVAIGARPDEVVMVLNGALSDNMVLPATVARSLAMNTLHPASPTTLDSEELSWLKSLAAGGTVAELSLRHGYSERELYRRLRRLYSRMGASGRTDALLRAVRWGWLE